MNKAENHAFVNGKWIPAEEEQYQPNLFERIVDKLPLRIRRLVSKFWFY